MEKNLFELFGKSSAYVIERKDFLKEDILFLVSQIKDRASSSIRSIDRVWIAVSKKKLEAKRKTKRISMIKTFSNFLKKLKSLVFIIFNI